MASFSLVPDPTFKAKVDIPVPGKKAQKLEFTFKWRNLDAFREFMDGLGDYEDDAAVVLEIVTGWELSDAFTPENVEKLVKNYIGSAGAILNTYLRENAAARTGN